MLGQVTRQELHRKLNEELNSFTRYIVSPHEPTEDIRDGFVWYNSETTMSSLYHNGEWITTAAGFKTDDGTFSLLQNIVKVTAKTKTINIGIEAFDKDTGELFVVANGIQMYPTDFTISEDSKTITKKEGYWNESGGSTDFFFSYFFAANLQSGVIPHAKYKQEEYEHKVNGVAKTIKVNFENFDISENDLEVYLNGLALIKAIDYTINESISSIVLTNAPKTGDSLLFRTWIDHGIKLYSNNEVLISTKEPDQPITTWYKIL